MKKRTLKFGAIVFACVLLVGCGGDSASSGSSAGTAVPSQTGKTAETGSGSSGALTGKESASDGNPGDMGSIVASDYVTLGQYKGLEVTIPNTTVSEGDIKTRIDGDLMSLGQTVSVTDLPIEDGDTVNIDYVGKKDGEAFQGGTASGYDLKIGSHSFIDGFEEGLIGAKVGDQRILHLNFPENYQSEELAGQAVTFDVKVNSISRNIVPSLNDETVKEIDSKYSSVAEYRKAIEDELKKDKSKSAQETVQTILMGKARENADFVAAEDFPAWLIERNVEIQKENLENTLKMYGASLEEYLKEIGQSEEEFDEELKEYAGALAEQQILIEAIFQAEGMSITDQEIDAAYEERAEEFGYESADEFKKTLKERNEESTFIDTIKSSKVQDMLLSTAVLTNPEMKTW
ncbi:MAG: trigger factor [Lachnospiraceae bacterium]|nr:trigger factor [Lachnospiraceae bacterium]